MGKKTTKKLRTELETPVGAGRHELSLTEEDRPLPSPTELAEYAKLDPRLLDLFIHSAEDEQRHRHQMEKGLLDLEAKKLVQIARVNKEDTKITIVGMCIVASLVFSLIGTSIFLFTAGMYEEGSWVAIVTAIAPAIIAIVRRKS